MSLTGDTFDFQQGNVVTSSAQIVDNGATTGDVLTVQADKSIAAAPGGGSQPVVSCLLACDAGIDVRPAVGHPIVWDALYDNAVSFNALLAIPAGLGLTFLFDGSAAAITTTEVGTWSFAYAFQRAVDATWQGQLQLAALDRNHQLTTGLVSGNVENVATDVLTLPSGVAIAPTIDTAVQATANPLTLVAYLSIVRLG